MAPGAADLLRERAAELPVDGPVPSPCISVCRIAAASGLCEGCFRTIEEIMAWGAMDDGARRAAWQVLLQRVGPA